jgi:hypothetical protein
VVNVWYAPVGERRTMRRLAGLCLLGLILSATLLTSAVHQSLLTDTNWTAGIQQVLSAARQPDIGRRLSPIRSIWGFR